MNYHALTGQQETTKRSEFYDITSVIDGLMPTKYNKIILGNNSTFFEN